MYILAFWGKNKSPIFSANKAILKKALTREGFEPPTVRSGGERATAAPSSQVKHNSNFDNYKFNVT